MKLHLIMLAIAMCLSGCNHDGKAKTEPYGRKLDSTPQIDYVIVEIEGKRWLATPGSHGEWSLAGPIE